MSRLNGIKNSTAKKEHADAKARARRLAKRGIGMKKTEGGWPLPMPDEGMMADLEATIKQRSYPSRNDKKRLVDEKFRIIVNAMERHFAEVDAEGMGYTGAILNRRKAAVYSYIEKAVRDFPKAAEQMISIEESIAGLEAGPSRTSYGGLDMNENILLAAALWILDDLKKNGKVYEAYEFLPQSFDDIIDMETPLEFFDPCFETDLIQSVMSVIHNRNRRPGKKIGFYQDFDDPCDASGKRPGADESEYRRNFEGMMGLIDPEHAKAAGEKFKEKVQDALKRYIEAMAVLDRQDIQAVRRVQQSGSGASILMMNPKASSERDRMVAIKEAVDTLDETNMVRKELDIGFENLLGMEVKEIKDRIGSMHAAKKISGFEIEDPYEICFGLLYLMDQGDDAPWMFHMGYCVLWNAAKLLPWFVPFGEVDDDWEDDWDDLDDAMIYNQGNWIQRQEKEGTEDKTDYYHERYDGKNIAQMVYEMTGAVVPRNLHPFEEKRRELKENGMDEALVDKVIADAEILFLTQFQSKARNLEGRSWQDFFRAEDEELNEPDEPDETDETVETEEAGCPEEHASESAVKKSVKATGYWGAVAKEQDAEISKTVDAGGKKAAEKAADKLTDGVEAKAAERRLKEENKGLRKALSELARQSAQEKAKLEKELKALRQEHRELADLRELVFNQENDESIKPAAESSIEFPYETQKRTVVFGGHETFLKQFKPKFTNVRFVDAEQYAFNPDLVRNADIVWIQNNRISHSQYYRIVNTARQYGIQVRYFPYASAEKCAEVLVEADRD